MADILNDAPGTIYKPLEKLTFKRLFLPLEEIFTLGWSNSPNLKTVRTQRKVARMNYELTLKEELPLPAFSLNFGTYAYNFANQYSKTAWDTDTRPGGKNLEIMASLNLTWSLFGENGLFNHRKRSFAYYNDRITEINYESTKNKLEGKIRRLYFDIKEYENQIKILQPMAITVKKKFDIMLNDYENNKTIYLNFIEAIEDLVETQTLLQKAMYYHLKTKIDLAKTIGVEDFPGENFENLAESNS